MPESETTNTIRDDRDRQPGGLDSVALRRSGAVIVMTVALAVAAVVRLPASVAVLWDASGQPVMTLPKPIAIASVLAVQVGVVSIAAIALRVDAVRETVAPFRDAYQWTAVALVSLAFVVFAAIVAWNSGLQFGGGQPLSTRVGALLAAVLLYAGSKALPALEQNRWVGIRSPWTMADEEVWDRTHDHGAPFFKAAAVCAVLAAAAPSPTLALGIIVVSVLAVLGYLYYYSYRIYDG